MRIIIGVILIVLGSYFGYNGYELKQTAAAKIEKEASAIANTLGADKINVKQDTNLEADIKLFGGAGVALLGLVLAGLGISKGKKK